MKKLLLIAAVLLVAGCSSLRQSPEQKRAEQKRAEQERIAALVAERLDARRFRIQIDYMLPLRGRGRAITDSYSLTVDGNKVNSYLPYFGTAYSVPYGGGEGLVFEDDIDSYAEDRSRPDRRIIQFSTNNGEDLLVYTLTVFDTGTADIHVNCRNRDDISYRGTLNPDAYPKD